MYSKIYVFLNLPAVTNISLQLQMILILHESLHEYFHLKCIKYIMMIKLLHFHLSRMIHFKHPALFLDDKNLLE